MMANVRHRRQLQASADGWRTVRSMDGLGAHSRLRQLWLGGPMKRVKHSVHDGGEDETCRDDEHEPGVKSV
jgi:hypothetical protein